jgi:hypothetical protein
MEGGKVADDMCPVLGFNISSIVPVGCMKTVTFYSFLTHNIYVKTSIFLWNDFISIGLILFLYCKKQDEAFCFFGITEHY